MRPESIFAVAFAAAIITAAAVGFAKKSYRLAWTTVGLAVLWQALYWFGTTSVDVWVPLSVIFRYDLIAGIARCFPGSWAEQVLLETTEIGAEMAASIVNWVASFGRG